MATDGEIPDGRNRRAARSRRAAAEALLDLVVEGQTRPTAQMVAERSGLSLSTIFRLYEDLDALNAAAIATQADRIAPLLDRLDPAAPLAERIEKFVASRVRLYETIGPVRRFAKALAPSSALIDTHLRSFDSYLRTQTLDLFAAELADHGDPDVVGELLDAWTSWDTWERLRSGQSLSVERSRAALADGLVRLLGR
ncbi:MAG: hypothetical protein JJU45_02400 [Acidimicrobiia bacterium]|nr:hypothetical protein [Acidimicrobiia bacterium]